MRFPFAKTIDYQVECQFRKDPAGRVVFFPFGAKKQGYFLESQADEEKIKTYLRKYRGTAMVISLLVSPSIYVPNLLLDLYGSTRQMHSRLTTLLELSVFVMVVFLAFSWTQWVSYKQAMLSFTTTLTEIGPELRPGLSQVCERPRVQRLVLACLLACLILAGAAFVGATRYSRSRVLCPPNAASSSQ